jgi:hypothetical protein
MDINLNTNNSNKTTSEDLFDSIDDLQPNPIPKLDRNSEKITTVWSEETELHTPDDVDESKEPNSNTQTSPNLTLDLNADTLSADVHIITAPNTSSKINLHEEQRFHSPIINDV